MFALEVKCLLRCINGDSNNLHLQLLVFSQVTLKVARLYSAALICAEWGIWGIGLCRKSRAQTATGIKRADNMLLTLTCVPACGKK